MIAEAVCAESKSDVAVTVMTLEAPDFATEGKVAGAVYTPVVAFTLPPLPSLGRTLQVTAVHDGRPDVVLLELHALVTALTGTPLTEATNGKLSFVPTVNDEGATVTCTPDAIVRVAVAVTLVPETVPVTVTVEGLGTEAGAVYRPAELMVPTVVFPPLTLFTDQRTLAVEPVTLDTNCAVLLISTVPVVGEIVSPMVELL